MHPMFSNFPVVINVNSCLKCGQKIEILFTSLPLTWYTRHMTCTVKRLLRIVDLDPNVLDHHIFSIK